MSGWLEPGLRERLSVLRLRSPQRGPETQRGGLHRGRRRGRSMEFAEHRDYVPGDDLRHLDWNAYARHEKLVVKEFESELERTVLICLDVSASMAGVKLQRGLQLSAGLSWVGLQGADRVGLGLLGTPDGTAYHPPLRGRANWGKLMDWMHRGAAGGRAELGAGLRELAQRAPRSSLLVVLSDWLEPAEEPVQALRFAHFRKHQLAALQLLDQQDTRPEWFGSLRLTDVETAESRELMVDTATNLLYRQQLEQHGRELSQACSKLGFGWLCCPAEERAEQLLLQQLVAAGWLI